MRFHVNTRYSYQKGRHYLLLIFFLMVIFINVSCSKVGDVSAAPTSGDNTYLGYLGEYTQWSKIEISFNGPDSTANNPATNPFTVQVDVTFKGPQNQTYVVPAFYDGDGKGGSTGNIWKVRFSPDSAGDWSFVSSSPEPKLIMYTGKFKVTSAPVPGAEQIVDLSLLGRLVSGGGHYLRFSSGKYWVKGGIDDPENFIGAAIGNWDSKKAAIDYLSTKGVNSIYVITNNIDGDRNDSWPWLGETPQKAKENSDRFDIQKLQQWEDFFSYTQSKGIVLNIVLNDDSCWHGYNHDLYYREMVARFGYHPGIIWNIGEEANEIYSDAEQISLAAKMRSLDPFKHPVTVNRGSPWPFIGNPNFDLTSVQVGDGSLDFTNEQLADLNQVVNDLRVKSEVAGKSIPVMIDEIARVTQVNEVTRYKLRSQVLYPIYLAGGNYELHYYDAYYGTGTLTMQNLEPMLTDMQFARHFLESLPFEIMQPCNDMLPDKNVVCFGKAGDLYAIYLPKGGGITIDLQSVPGSYDASWFDPRTGTEKSIGSISGGKLVSLNAPDNLDWALKLVNIKYH